VRYLDVGTGFRASRLLDLLTECTESEKKETLQSVIIHRGFNALEFLEFLHRIFSKEIDIRKRRLLIVDDVYSLFGVHLNRNPFGHALMARCVQLLRTLARDAAAAVLLTNSLSAAVPGSPVVASLGPSWQAVPDVRVHLNRRTDRSSPSLSSSPPTDSKESCAFRIIARLQKSPRVPCRQVVLFE